MSEYTDASWFIKFVVFVKENVTKEVFYHEVRGHVTAHV